MKNIDDIRKVDADVADLLTDVCVFSRKKQPYVRNGKGFLSYFAIVFIFLGFGSKISNRRYTRSLS